MAGGWISFARALFAGLFFLISAPAAIGGGLLLAPLQGLIGLIGAPWERLARSIRKMLPLLPLFLFLLWVLASAVWSPSPNAPAQGVKIAGCFVFGIGFAAMAASAQEKAGALFRGLAVAGAALLVGLCLIEALGDMPINRWAQPSAETGVLERNPAKGVAIFCVWVWPVIASLAGGVSWERWLWRALLVGGLVVSLHFNMDANIAALVLGGAVYSLVYLAPRAGPILVFGAIAVWLAAAPWTMSAIANSSLLAKLPLSWQVRGQIWDYATRKIFDNPLWGAGLDASRMVKDVGHVGDLTFQAIPLHPHSASLQIWLETGAIGAAIGAIALMLSGVSLSHAFAKDKARSAAVCACATATALYWNLSFGAWQEWWLVVPFGAAALVVGLRAAKAPA